VLRLPRWTRVLSDSRKNSNCKIHHDRRGHLRCSGPMKSGSTSRLIDQDPWASLRSRLPSLGECFKHFGEPIRHCPLVRAHRAPKGDRLDARPRLNRDGQSPARMAGRTLRPTPLDDSWGFRRSLDYIVRAISSGLARVGSGCPVRAGAPHVGHDRGWLDVGHVYTRGTESPNKGEARRQGESTNSALQASHAHASVPASRTTTFTRGDLQKGQ